jgi:ParB-like chromosome segregation protein Spo0J
MTDPCSSGIPTSTNCENSDAGRLDRVRGGWSDLRAADAASRRIGSVVSHAAGRKSPVSQAWVELSSLVLGDSPREKEDMPHARLLAAAPAELPPILVHRSTRRIVDGLHRALAAKLRGETCVAVEFFDGTREEAFLEAVRRNTVHGKPLTLAERERAAERVIRSHPELSDRAIAAICGLSPGTIRLTRHRCGALVAPGLKTVGRDGKRRPTDPALARQRVQQALHASPGASLREIARATDTSPSTVRDVQRRLAEGRSPLPDRLRSPAAPPPAPDAPTPEPDVSTPEPARPVSFAEDNAIAGTDQSQAFAAWFDARRIEPQEWACHVDAVPLSRVYAVVDEARRVADDWARFAAALEARVSRNRRRGVGT